MSHAPRVAALAAVMMVTLALAACNKPDDPTVGQRVDGAVSEAGRAGQEIRQEAKEAAGAVADTAKDIAITAKVNAALAADSSLSAMRIDVDTTAARVTLTGTAPDTAARDRAATLAGNVEGVRTVDNRLAVEGKR